MIWLVSFPQHITSLEIFLKGMFALQLDTERTEQSSTDTVRQQTPNDIEGARDHRTMTLTPVGLSFGKFHIIETLFSVSFSSFGMHIRTTLYGKMHLTEA